MTSVPFDHLSREALDHELSPSRSAKDPWGVLRRHAEVTASLDSAPGLTVLRDRRATGQSTHPFFWAAFVAAGDWR